jgi:hypothetical protein
MKFISGGHFIHIYGGDEGFSSICGILKFPTSEPFEVAVDFNGFNLMRKEDHTIIQTICSKCLKTLRSREKKNSNLQAQITRTVQ